MFESEPLKGIAEIFDETSTKLNDESNIDLNYSGSTVISIFFNKTNLYCANVGDSRAIIGKRNNNDRWSVIPLSRDHKPVDKEEA